MYMSKTLLKYISFSDKAQKKKKKMNSYLNIPVYSLISPSNIRDENKINN